MYNSKPKRYWKDIAELNNDPAIKDIQENEFPSEIPIDEFIGNNSLVNTSTSRRDFLKFMGFSLGAATLASCETPVQKAIPYLFKPQEIIPGVANWYASSYFDGNDFSNVLVKTRDGRPIKIEGNSESKLTRGSVNARIQASVLSLYDSTRLKGPMVNGNLSSWENVDKWIIGKLQQIAKDNGTIAILSSTIISPTTKKVIAEFSAKYGNVKHIMYDSISYSGWLDANQEMFGKRVLPSFHFNKAKVIVSFVADFLANWYDVDAAKQYAEGRNPKTGTMSRHIQFESNLSLTGSNADNRIPIKPSEEGVAIINLYNELAQKAGKSTFSSNSTSFDKKIKSIANELWANQKKSIVISNSNSKNIQIIINTINELLGNNGSTIDIESPVYLKQGNDPEVNLLIEDMKAGNIKALLVYNSNPAYTFPNVNDLFEGLSKVPLKISFSDRLDETASLMDYVCPTNHFLESWDDANPKKGYYCLQQPTISPLFDTRQFQATLLTWAENNTDYYTFLEQHWEDNILLKKAGSTWEQSLHDGCLELDNIISEDVEVLKGKNTEKESTPYDLSSTVASIVKKSKGGEMELVLYQKIGIGDGSQANNPWLQELPDPISKTTWDNYLTISPVDAERLHFKNWYISNGAMNGNYANISIDGITIQRVPVMVQPGQATGTVGLALGYGRTKCGKVGDKVGVNAFPLAKNFLYSCSEVTISNTGGEHEFACTQLHHTMMGRDIVKETNLTEYIKNNQDGNLPVTIPTSKGQKKPNQVTLWDEFDHSTGHFWNISIDLTKCIGCSSCVISCHVENNVPVVGKEEIRKSRDMHWIRIDRYFSSDAEKDDFNGLEIPSSSENLEVVYQPVMCQHCNHAPCETVCPVGATSHSTEGLNHMAYNRCVGTRYCANNCPYKVRRFNWFQYDSYDQFTDINPAQDDLGRMVLNPDIVVRARGVMEKCSMCIQRIQEGKLKAKKKGEKIKDGDIQPACVSVCPTNAIVFGDANDKSSQIAQLKEDERKYYLLEQLDVQPSVFYQTKVRNKG